MENRIIKFRGWVAKHNQFADSVSVYSDGSHLMEIGDVGGYQGVVSQFTGLTDKNGKEIYEGDVVQKDVFPYGESAPNGKVVFTSNKFQCEVVIIGEDQDDWYDYDGNNFYWDELEVIGNIYENPELLK